MTMFRDRTEAGKALGGELAKLRLPRPVVLALPRGGVPVAAEIAVLLKAPLDLVIVRKVGAPGNPELAVAAIVDGNPPDIVLNREVIEAYQLDDEVLATLIDEERQELLRRRALFRGTKQPLSIEGRTVILVDDGAATGTTMKVALKALRRRSPRELIVALPAASTGALNSIAAETHRLICLAHPEPFRALSCHYQLFDQLSDEDVLRILREAAERRRKEGLSIIKV